MKFLDVARMLKAGFTADEIRKMDQETVENNPQNPQDNFDESETIQNLQLLRIRFRN